MILEKPITPALVAIAATAYYTADAGLKRAIIKKLTFHNGDTVARTIIVYLGPAAGTASITNQLTETKSLLPDETWECYEAVNQSMLGGWILEAVASVASKVSIHGTILEHS
jgi:hypothetical protein